MHLVPMFALVAALFQAPAAAQKPTPLEVVVPAGVRFTVIVDGTHPGVYVETNSITTNGKVSIGLSNGVVVTLEPDQIQPPKAGDEKTKRRIQIQLPKEDDEKTERRIRVGPLP